MDKLSEVLKYMSDINISDPENILKEFEELFLLNSTTVNDALNKENLAMKANYKYDKLKAKFEILKKYDYDKLTPYSSIGTIVCFSNGDPYFLLELIIKAILTKSKILFISDAYMFNIDNLLVEIAKKALEKFKIHKEAISILSLQNYKDILKVQDFIDCIVINKNYERYKEMQELTDIKVTYSDYGNINVYTDSDDFKNDIKELALSAKKEDKEVFIAKSNDIKEYLINSINNFVFHSVAVYTKNAEKCMYFLKNIKAENVYINTNPLVYSENIISEYEFLYKKNVVY